MEIIRDAAGTRLQGIVLDNGCGVGQYLERLNAYADLAIGLEFEPEHARTAHARGLNVVRAASENLPYASGTLDLVLSHEVLEHVRDDRLALEEIVRVLKPPRPHEQLEAGRLVLFIPNRGYPFETHGVYWGGRYHFGNIPLVNYLPHRLRNRLAPHVRVYSRRSLEKLLEGLPVLVVSQTVIFGGYDNIIARWPRAGRLLRWLLQKFERTPLRALGLSQVWVIERKAGDASTTTSPF
ncbi:MAG: class I SAM-dependent methyltransferase [Anaerolineales bacterium]|nr:MAG: class I SAM-dependent methyltransferase [Anaerolineales bacterium]